MAFMLRSFGQNTDASSPNRFVPKGSRPVTKRENGKSTRRASDFFFSWKKSLETTPETTTERKGTSKVQVCFSNQIESQNYQLSIISLDSKKKSTTDTVFQPFSSDSFCTTPLLGDSKAYVMVCS